MLGPGTGAERLSDDGTRAVADSLARHGDQAGPCSDFAPPALTPEILRLPALPSCIRVPPPFAVNLRPHLREQRLQKSGHFDPGDNLD
jgi:hypothetical protein